MEQEKIKKNLSEKSTWMRLLYMVLLTIAYAVAEFLLYALVIFQFLFKAFTGSLNEKIYNFSTSLTTYIKQILDYLTFESEERPFPFADWPQASVK